METNDVSNSIPDLVERSGRWLADSIIVKLLSIAFLTLVLLIPSAWIQGVMEERMQRANAVIDEVSRKWAYNQTLTGPVLVIPFARQEVVTLQNGTKESREVIDEAYFMPEQLTIKGTVAPEIRHRALFDVTVYKSNLDFNATFVKPDFKSLNIAEEAIRWNDARLIVGVTDIRGISDNPVFTVGNDKLTTEPSNAIGIRFADPENDSNTSSYVTREGDLSIIPTGWASSGITTRLNWTNADSFTSQVAVKLSLKGSRRLDFVPTGKTTQTTLSGDWGSASFDGDVLPDTSNVDNESFHATWKVLNFNRPFTQQWTGTNVQLGNSNFGVKLLVPVDQYQKSIRTAKYGVLLILLTFVALFLVEIVKRIRIHPFQYILVGVALTIYYTLLLSISEYLGYNAAYAIASLATVALIGAYSTSFLKGSRLVALFVSVLILFYGFIFVIILQQDFSLLFGSIGLFLITGVVMYFSRKVNWYATTKNDTITRVTQGEPG